MHDCTTQLNGKYKIPLYIYKDPFPPSNMIYDGRLKKFWTLLTCSKTTDLHTPLKFVIKLMPETLLKHDLVQTATFQSLELFNFIDSKTCFKLSLFWVFSYPQNHPPCCFPWLAVLLSFQLPGVHPPPFRPRHRWRKVHWASHWPARRMSGEPRSEESAQGTGTRWARTPVVNGPMLANSWG